MKRALFILLAACGSPTIGEFTAQESALKASDRQLIGAAAPYVLQRTESEAALRSDDTLRTQLAWRVLAHLFEEVPLNGLPATLPRWRTWYDTDDFTRVFKQLYREQGTSARKQRSAFPREAIANALKKNERAADGLPAWTPEHFAEYAASFDTPEKVAGVAATSRIVMSEDAFAHVLDDYPLLLSAPKLTPFTPSSVIVKAEWRRAEFGNTLETFDDTPRTDWSTPDGSVLPSAIYKAQLPNGNVFELAAMHVMAKELDHWVWLTLWWSEAPSPSPLKGVWSNYDMCSVVWFEDGSGQSTWCSNRYLEKGPGNAQTNCIGCHQHAGTTPPDLITTPDFARKKARDDFPADYFWSLKALRQVMQQEEAHYSAFE